MGYETIRSLNPEVIYSYAPGWGSSGPDAARSGFAPLFSGFVGLHHESAGEGNIPTSPPGNEDNGNGLLGAAAILFALYHRAQTGKGQYLEHPQLNATMLMGLHLMRGADGSVLGSMGLDHERRGVHPLDRLYRTADGWLCISARTDAEFARLGGVPAFAELRDDSRFADADARLATERTSRPRSAPSSRPRPPKRGSTFWERRTCRARCRRDRSGRRRSWTIPSRFGSGGSSGTSIPGGARSPTSRSW